MTAIAAVILMGGRGERLGGADKSGLDIGGRTLLSHVLGRLSPCSPILLATGPQPRTVPGHLTIADLPGETAGPLAGVAAAVAALVGHEADWLLSVAVDTPFTPADFIGRALTSSAEADVIMGAYCGQDYPTQALWRLAAIADLPARLAAGTAPRSLHRLAQTLRLVRLDYSHLPEDPFSNANTPDDLANLRQRAARGGPR